MFSLGLLTACHSLYKGGDISYDLTNAIAAYDYPDITGKSDTDIYVYQLKNIISRHDSFIYVTTGSQYLKQFNEENLSLKPLPLETFRFSYSLFDGRPVNITFNKNEIVVKKGLSGLLFPLYNIQKLDSVEAIKLHLMETTFFLSRQTLSQRKFRRYDSMMAIYPEMASVNYYKALIDKCTDYDTLRFTYSTNRIAITPRQYESLLDLLKKSNFDHVPWYMSPSEVAMDGVGYSFEANTKTKYKYFFCFGREQMNATPMTKFCRHLLKLAKVDKQIDF